MHTRAAVAAFDPEASNKIVTGKVTSDRSMSRPFPTAALLVRGVLCRSGIQISGVGTLRHVGKIMAAEREGESARHVAFMLHGAAGRR